MVDSGTEKSLDGMWQMVRAELAGEGAPELIAQRTTLELSDGVYRVRFDDQIVDQGRFEINASEPFAIVQFFGTAGPNNGRVIASIYQRVRDRLRVCYGLDGFQPTEFATVAGQKRYLATYRKISD
jgi:uncharacterized protein (TIGR03067 family)